MEIKLLIFGFLDEGHRVITFKCRRVWLVWGNHTELPILFLAKPLAPPLMLSICHETRAQALKRYTRTLSGEYSDFRIDFRRDIIHVIPVVGLGHRFPKTGGLMPCDLKRIRNLSIKAGPDDRNSLHWESWWLEMLSCETPNAKYVFPRIPSDPSDCHHASLRQVLEISRQRFPEMVDLTFTCRSHFPKDCPSPKMRPDGYCCAYD